MAVTSFLATWLVFVVLPIVGLCRLFYLIGYNKGWEKGADAYRELP